jgi:hypothetical protein
MKHLHFYIFLGALLFSLCYPAAKAVSIDGYWKLKYVNYTAAKQSVKYNIIRPKSWKTNKLNIYLCWIPKDVRDSSLPPRQAIAIANNDDKNYLMLESLSIKGVKPDKNMQWILFNGYFTKSPTSGEHWRFGTRKGIDYVVVSSSKMKKSDLEKLCQSMN